MSTQAAVRTSNPMMMPQITELSLEDNNGIAISKINEDGVGPVFNKGSIGGGYEGISPVKNDEKLIADILDFDQSAENEKDRNIYPINEENSIGGTLPGLRVQERDAQ